MNKQIWLLVKKIYHSQRHSSVKRGHNPPEYSEKELEKWMLAQDIFLPLYNKWIESGKNRWERPSIDRINDDYGYAFDNIQLMTWRENDIKAKREGSNGIGSRGKICRKVVQLSGTGEFIAEYVSITKAAEAVSVGISSIHLCISKKIQKVKGFIWMLKSEYLKNGPDADKITSKRMARIVQLNEKGVFIESHKNIATASRTTGIRASRIYAAANGISSYAGNYIWVYEFNYDKSKKYFFKRQARRVTRINPIDMSAVEYLSISDAARANNCLPGGICKAASKENKIYSNFFWRYV